MKSKKYYSTKRTKEPQTTKCQCIYYYTSNQRYMDIPFIWFPRYKCKRIYWKTIVLFCIIVPNCTDTKGRVNRILKVFLFYNSRNVKAFKSHHYTKSMLIHWIKGLCHALTPVLPLQHQYLSNQPCVVNCFESLLSMSL